MFSYMTTRDVSSWIGSVVSTFAIIGTIVGWLPYIAAFAAFVWYIIQIWESRTIQHWHNNRKMARRARKVAKLRAREKVISAQLAALQTVQAAKQVAKDMVNVATMEAAVLSAQEETDIMAKKIHPTEE